MKRTVVLILLAMLALAVVGCQAPAGAPQAVSPTAAAAADTPTAGAVATAALTATAAPLATATEEPEGGAFVLCPEVDRPALLLSVPHQGYLVANPVTGETCATELDGSQPAGLQVGGDALYWVVMGDDGYVVRRMGTDGQTTDLAFTARTMEEAMGFYSFVISPDGRQMAWAVGRPAADNGGETVSEMWVANTDGSEVVSPLGERRSSGGQSRALVPVRLSSDGSTLFYTWQPLGVGGSWSAFSGRYDNLYALRLRTDAPETAVFDCAEIGLFMCLGDFLEMDGQASLLAYVDGDGALVVENGLGDTLNAIAPEGANYVAYPTFHENGEMVFYAAELSDDSLMPAGATIYRVAPPTAPAEALASEPGLLPPRAWLDETRVVVGYAAGESDWRTAVVGLDGTVNVLEAANASLMAVLNESGAANAPAVGFGPRATYEDSVAGVAVDYPEGWNILDVAAPAKESSPVYAVSFFSWEPEAAGSEGIPAGGTKFDLVVMDTEAGSLEEAIAERKAAMAEAELPTEILSEERWTLAGGLEAVRWMVEGHGATALVALTFVDGRMVMISGLGDLGLVEAIARSLRPL